VRLRGQGGEKNRKTEKQENRKTGIQKYRNIGI